MIPSSSFPPPSISLSLSASLCLPLHFPLSPSPFPSLPPSLTHSLRLVCRDSTTRSTGYPTPLWAIRDERPKTLGPEHAETRRPSMSAPEAPAFAPSGRGTQNKAFECGSVRLLCRCRCLVCVYVVSVSRVSLCLCVSDCISASVSASQSIRARATGTGAAGEMGETGQG
jgi:hypothetical protein